jgi:choline dehydrogenase-like flavoprotein
LLIDARTLPSGTAIQCEVCVVGGGAAGISAALELAGKGRDIVLLDAGGLKPEAAAQDSYRGEVESSPSGDVHPPLESVRQKLLGGTTSSWGGRCLPLDEQDLVGWPLGLADLEPYFRRAHPYLHLGEYEYSSTAALPGSGRFVVGSEGSALVRDDLVWRYSLPTHFGKAYARRLRELSQLRVYCHANVLGLELAPDGTAVSMVRASGAPDHELRVKARAYVLAAGGLETTRLLLLSERQTNGRAAWPSELVGRGYMTHLDGAVGRIRFRSPPPRPAYAYELSHDGVYCRRLVTLTPQARRQEGLPNLGFVFTGPPARDPTHGDGLLSAYALTKEFLYRSKLGFKSARYGIGSEPLAVWPHVRNVGRDAPRLAAFGAVWTRRRLLASRKLPSFLAQPRSREYSIIFNAEQSPSDGNRLTLSDERDAFGVPRLRVAWRTAESDVVGIARALGLIRGELQRLGLDSVELPVTAEGLRIENGGFMAGTHAMGTTRMGASARNGVVDAGCQLKGVPNLYVASSSVFPTSGFAAPTLTIVALALRICDAIERSLR